MIRYYLTILTVITCFATSANSSETRVRVFVGSDFPLIFEKDISNPPKGLAIDILNKISKELDTRIEVKFYPWKRALLAVKNGSVDGIIAAYKTAERSEFLDYAEKPIFVDKMVVVAYEDWKGGWNGDWQTLKGRKFSKFEVGLMDRISMRRRIL